VKLHKTQVAAVGQGSVKVLGEMQTDKTQKILQYVCFCSATMLTSKIVRV